MFEKYYESAILLRLALLPPPRTNPIDFDPKASYLFSRGTFPSGGGRDLHTQGRRARTPVGSVGFCFFLRRLRKACLGASDYFEGWGDVLDLSEIVGQLWRQAFYDRY